MGVIPNKGARAAVRYNWSIPTDPSKPMNRSFHLIGSFLVATLIAACGADPLTTITLPVQESAGISLSSSDPISSSSSTPIDQLDSPTPVLHQGHSLGLNQTINRPIRFRGWGGVILKGRLVIPPGQGPFSAVVVMHGCAGLWNNAASFDMKSQFDDWAEIFAEDQVVGLFVDSFTPRGIDGEFCGVTPPDDSIASPAYVRPNDAYAALAFLRKITFQNNQAVVGDQPVALMGFSHGGTSTLSAIADLDLSDNSPWTVRYDGIEYPAPPPGPRPANDGFVTAVAYYPGAGFYNYFGSSKDPSNGHYAPYAPTIMIYGDQDGLYANGDPDRLIEKTILSGSLFPLDIQVYSNAGHSFDGQENGPNGSASDQARDLVRNWFQTYL